MKESTQIRVDTILKRIMSLESRVMKLEDHDRDSHTFMIISGCFMIVTLIIIFISL